MRCVGWRAAKRRVREQRRVLHTDNAILRKIPRLYWNALMTERRREPLAGPSTDDIIDLADPKSMIYWCTRLKCSDEELRFVVKHYGVVAKDIEAFFARCRY